ncbi:MAG: hypothetical protein J5835_00515 [Bacteroidales bacterium]|nr:hypothetical protein [Bacteroidales bacterium]
MKRFGHIVILLAAALMASGCGVSKLKDVRISSWDYKYITPTSSRSVDALLLLGIDNPGPAVKVTGLAGNLKYGDRSLVDITGEELLLDGKTEKVYELPCSASLSEGVSLLSLIPLLSQDSAHKLKADLRMHVALKSGLGTDLVFNDLSISEIAR